MIPLFKPYMAPNVLEDLNKIVHSGYIGQGNIVNEFELNLKNKLKTDFLVTTNSCTSALKIALKLLPLNGTILSTPLTCVATTNAILLDGRFDLKWLDVDPNTCNIDLESLKESVNKFNPVAIVLVHWGGYPNYLDQIKNIVGDIPIVEDCAHAFGSLYKQQPIGSHGNYCAFSFGPIKHLTCGDGGALVLKNSIEEEDAKLYRWYGINRENREDLKNYSLLGDKCNMNNINACIGNCNIKNIDLIINKHRENAEFYDNNLNFIDGISIMERHKDCNSSYWLYTIKVENKNDFEKAMNDRKIETCLHHKRNDIYSFESFKRYEILPKLYSFYDRLTNIPVGAWVEPEAVVDAIKKGW